LIPPDARGVRGRPRERALLGRAGGYSGELNELVEQHGLVFGADTSTSDVATLGGMLGNNSAGMRSLYYGTTADQILSLRCVLASGETVEINPSPGTRPNGVRGEADPKPGC
jgi:FAD/FMN-containing dehydrogenase